MTVTVSGQLPTFGSNLGGVTVQPLGGDGYISAQSVFRVKLVCDGDASSGDLVGNIRFDPRYCMLVSQVGASIRGMTADVPIRFSITESPNNSTFVAGSVAKQDWDNGVTGTCSWSPEPIVISADFDPDPSTLPLLSVRIPNDAAHRLNVYAHIFTFNKRAREIIPLDQITNVLHRSVSLQ